MSNDWQTANVYVFIKTYPVLSKSYKVLICTAAIWEKKDGSYELIRMYPVPFDFYKKNYGYLKKFMKIRVEIKRNVEEKLRRRDSFKVKFNNFKVIDDSLTYKKGRKLSDEVWKRRNDIVKEVSYKSVEELEELKNNMKISLGVIKPKKVYDFTKTHINGVNRPWEKALLEDTQKTLSFFSEGKSYKDVRPIEHIPWKFSYKFECNDPRCSGHNMMCEDWELLQLWRREKKDYGRNDDEAFEKVREKYYDKFVNEKDINFVMGTESRWNKWIIIGVYYAPKDIPLPI